MVILLQCGVVNFIPSYLLPINGQSRAQLIMVYLTNDCVRVSLVYIM